jgi:hypothetical protein
MSINHLGKEECILHKIILRSYSFIEDDHSYNDQLNTSLILMSTSINLDGKKQIVNHEDENETAVIIEAMIKRL